MQFATFPPTVRRFGSHLGEALVGTDRVRAIEALTSATALVLDGLPPATTARLSDGSAPPQLAALVLDVAARAYRGDRAPAELTPDDLAALAAIVA